MQQQQQQQYTDFLQLLTRINTLCPKK